MGIKEAESKYLAKQKKRRGLQKTRFYCQICERQCLDENGFKCHVKSELHMKNVKKKLEEKGGDSTKVLNDYSREMEKDFLRLLRVSHGEKFVSLNKFYQEYISNRDHIHLNATRWKSITGFAHHLAKAGKVRSEASSAADEPHASRIAYLRDSGKGKTAKTGPTGPTGPTAAVGEAITCVGGDEDDEEGLSGTGTDAMSSRQSRAAKTATATETATATAAAATETATATAQESQSGNTLASRGKVAFTLRKKTKTKTKTKTGAK